MNIIRNYVLCVIFSFILGALSVWLVVEPIYKEEITKLKIKNEALNARNNVRDSIEFHMMASRIDSLMDAHDYNWPKRKR